MNGSLLEIASSSNGRTADSDSVNLGSNPGEAANKKNAPLRAFFLLAEKHLLNGEGRGSNRARGAFCSGTFPARRSAGEV